VSADLEGVSDSADEIMQQGPAGGGFLAAEVGPEGFAVEWQRF
jgi:hypothetical protein